MLPASFLHCLRATAILVALCALILPAQAAHTIDHSDGFASHSDLTTTGSTTIVGSVVRLTDGGYGEAGTLRSKSIVYVGTFNTSFTFRLIGGDGFADATEFAVSNGDRYVVLVFDTYYNSPSDVSANSMYVLTPEGRIGNTNLDGTGIDLHNGDVFKADVSYDGVSLSVTLTDTVTAAKVIQNYTVNVASELGARTGNVGFNGFTGGVTSTQDIQMWTYDSQGQLSLTGVSPGTIAQGSPDTTLTVSGTGFASNSIVKWNGLAQQTSFVSYNKLTAVIPASLLKAAGTAQVTVTTPKVGTSNAKTVTIAVTTLGLTVGPVRRFSNGDLAVPLLLTNTGYNSAPSLQLTTATLNNLGAKTTLPLSFGTVAAYYPTAALLTFPMTAGETGDKVTLKVGGTFTSGTFSNSVTIALP